MSTVKKDLLIRIVGLLLEITGVLLLAVFVYTGFISPMNSDAIYTPKPDKSTISGQLSSTDNMEEQIVSSSQRPSGEKSSNVSDILQDKSQSGSVLGQSQPDSSNTKKPASSKRTSSKASSKTTSSKKTSSKPTSSKEEDSAPEASAPEASLPESLPQSTPPFESDVSSKEDMDDTQTLQNEKKAIQIAQSYSVSIEIATPQSGITNENILEYAQNSQDIKRGLSQLEAALQTFPSDYFGQAATDTSFILASKTVTGDITLVKKTIIVPCFKTINSNQLKSFLLSISSSQLSTEVTAEYSSYNPEDFSYGYIQAKYNYSASQPERGYFLSSESQKSQEAELYAIFMTIFERGSFIISVPKASPLYPKLTYTAQLLVEWSPCFSELEAVKSLLES